MDAIDKRRRGLKALTGMSNRYGGDPRYVLAGGGNSSWKYGGEMYIKSSGVSLATITSEGFAGMDRQKLNLIMRKPYDRGDDAKREAEVLADMMGARLPGYENLRPSVETPLHNLFPYEFVLHLHPAIVNGMTCGINGEAAARELFGDNIIWIPEYKPGYELSKLCMKMIDEYTGAYGGPPRVIFLQNHGVFAAADSVREIDAIYAEIMDKLDEYAVIKPVADSPYWKLDSSDSGYLIAGVQAGSIVDRLSSMPSPPSVVYYSGNPDAAGLLIDGAGGGKTAAHAGKSGRDERPLSLNGAFTPDHIVYCKADYLYLDCAGGDDLLTVLPGRYTAFADKHGYAPRVICINGAGALICANSMAEAENARILFDDALKIIMYSENFGGPKRLSDELVDFITHWEIEQYRSKVAQK